MDEPSLQEWIDAVLQDDWLIPTAEMEAVLAHSHNAVPTLIAAVEDSLANEDTDRLLWATVLLGELQASEAVPVLIEILRRAAGVDTLLSVAAEEALAKVGAAALPALESSLATGRPDLRHWIYAAAGAIDHDAAHDLLLRALGTDAEMVDLVATALSEYRRERDIPPIYDTLHRCEPWQRPEIEEALREVRAEPPQRLHRKDWRLRYRLDPKLGAFELSWPVVALIMRAEDVHRNRGPQRSVPNLEQILAHQDKEPKAPKCKCCGVETWSSTGVRVCPATALDIAIIQVELLGRFREEENSDELFELLDELDLELWELKATDRPRRGKSRRQREDVEAGLEIQRGACIWAIERGLRGIGAARAALLAEAALIKDRYGDPHGVLTPVANPIRDAASVGRNDPCPCGSGRKYKKCCAVQAAATRVEPARTVPTLVTREGTRMSFSHAHYTVHDEAAVRHALAQCGELAAEPMDNTFAWIERRGDDEIGLIGTVRIDQSGLVLECISEERLSRGKLLIARIAGSWLTHRLDTTQDPWQAVAANAGRPKAMREDIPSEEEAELIQRIMHRHYRTWADEPLPALHGRSARECTRDPTGRTRVTELLRSMEEMEARKPPMQRYDFTWLWSELGLERAVHQS